MEFLNNITLCNAEPRFAVLGRGRCFLYKLKRSARSRRVWKTSSEAKCAFRSKLHMIFYARVGRSSRHSGTVWYNIRKSRNIWYGDFHRTWTVKLMNCACSSAGKVNFTPNIPWSVNFNKLSRNDARNVLPLHIVQATGHLLWMICDIYFRKRTTPSEERLIIE